MLKSYSMKEQEELCAIAREKYRNEYPCDLHGRFPWECERSHGSDGKTLSLSKDGLGKFAYEVLIRGGDIRSLWAFECSPRAAVYPRFILTMEMRDDLVSKCGYAVRSPPVAHFN